MRTAVIVAAVLGVVLGLLAIGSAFARGLGITNGVLVGVVLLVAGGSRLFIEARGNRGQAG